MFYKRALQTTSSLFFFNFGNFFDIYVNVPKIIVAEIDVAGFSKYVHIFSHNFGFFFWEFFPPIWLRQHTYQIGGTNTKFWLIKSKYFGRKNGGKNWWTKYWWQKNKTFSRKKNW